jgi:hypothetical protein
LKSSNESISTALGQGQPTVTTNELAAVGGVPAVSGTPVELHHFVITKSPIQLSTKAILQTVNTQAGFIFVTCGTLKLVK